MIPISLFVTAEMIKFTIACLSTIASANLAGDTEFESIGKIDFKLSSYIQLG